MAKVLVISSSYRKKSNSRLLADEVVRGAAQAGHDVRTVDISRLRIEPCRGCDACHAPKSKGCVIDDDMQALFPQILDADVLVLASPVYWFSFCGQLKQCIDRWYAIAAGPGREEVLAKKKIAAVLTYGDEDIFKAGGVNALRCLQDICAYAGAQWAGAVYGTATDPGEIANAGDLLREAREFGGRL